MNEKAVFSGTSSSEGLFSKRSTRCVEWSGTTAVMRDAISRKSISDHGMDGQAEEREKRKNAGATR